MAKTVMCVWTVLALLAACGPKQPAEQPRAASEEAPAASEPGPAEPAASVGPEENTESPSASEAVSGPPAAGLRTQCEKVCQKVAAKCSKTIAENCEINCEKYDKTPKSCESYAREALSCAETAKDLPCANMAPESCAKQYRTVTECQRAPESFQVKAEEKKKLPEGWGIYDEGAFSVPTPGGVTKSSVGQETVWTASAGKVRYTVRKLPALTEKLTPKSQQRLANQWLKPCTLKLKLHGHVEKADRSTLHYDSACKDGGERHGMVYVTSSALYIVGVEAPAGEKAEMETFVYGFALK
jgi:hypothetical protein